MAHAEIGYSHAAVARRCTLFMLAILPCVANAQAQAPTSAQAPTAALQELLANPDGACGAIAELRTVDVRLALGELYRRTGLVPLWRDKRRLSALQRELRQLDDDGLDPDAYEPVPTAATEACADLQLSSRYLLALEHLSRGRFDLRAVEPSWDAAAPPPVRSRPVVELAMQGLEDVADAFDAARPTLPLYRELRTANRNTPPATWQPIPAGPTLRPGASDPRLAQLAGRLRAEGFLDAGALAADPPGVYGRTLEQAVRTFQEHHGLKVDGLVGRRTLAALNVAPARRAMQVRINLERLRWLDARREEHLLVVNIAGGHIRLYRGDELVWQARVLTGQPARPTPLLVSRIDGITFNPDWIVPPTILKEDKLPQIRADPRFLAENDLQVMDYQGQLLDPAAVDWNSAAGIMLRQAPGPRNPLGKFAFRMQSPYFIYLHDTPDQNRFESPVRNISSGCVRVEDAAGLAGLLLRQADNGELVPGNPQEDGGATQEVRLAQGPQLIIAYWTAEAADDGLVRFFNDPYGFDGRLIDVVRRLDLATAEDRPRAPDSTASMACDD